MKRTLDEWLIDFQNLSHEGWFSNDLPAMRFRKMELANAKLKELLRKFMDDVIAKVEPPKSEPQKNGLPQPTQPTVKK